MVAIKLFGPVRFVVVGAPKYFDKMGRPKHPKDLLSHNCLRVRVDDDWIYDKWEFEQKGKAFHVQIKGCWTLRAQNPLQKSTADFARIVGQYGCESTSGL
jgi:hypothetical protein